MSHTCNFYFLIATFKKLLKGEISFNKIFYLIHYVQNTIISTCNHYKIINEVHYILFLARSSTADTYSASQFGLAIFQVLSGYVASGCGAGQHKFSVLVI